jgi:peptide/nickel transport system permease protein
MPQNSRFAAVARVVGRRAVAGVLVMWGAATLTFIGLHATKGDPALVLLGGPEANPTPQALAEVRAEYGFGKPLWVQYGIYFGHLLHGNLGYSYQQHETVVSAIGIQLAPTVQLAVAAAITSVVLALVVSLGTAGRGRAVRAAVSGVTTFLASMPGFVLALCLLFLFAAAIPIFPSAGNNGPQSLVLPVLSLALPIAAHLIQVLWPELEDVLEQPFILTARTRGMGVAGVKLRHALRHALVPIATMTGFIIAGLLAGAVLVETVYSRQGLGRLATTAVGNQDLPLVLGVVIFAALVFVVVNFVIDIVYSLIDPRLATV